MTRQRRPWRGGIVGADKMVGDEELEVGSTEASLPTRFRSSDLVVAVERSRRTERRDVMTCHGGPCGWPAADPAVTAPEMARCFRRIGARRSRSPWQRSSRPGSAPIPAYIRHRAIETGPRSAPVLAASRWASTVCSRRARWSARSEEFRRLLSSNALGTGFIVGLGSWSSSESCPRLWVALVFVCATVVLTHLRARRRGASSRGCAARDTAAGPS